MEQIIVPTKLFKDIFPTYEDFATWVEESGMTGEDFSIPRKTTFMIIYNHYACSHVAFTEETFKMHFLNELYTFCGEFEATTDAIVQLRNLTDEEIAVADSMIENFANIPETEQSTDTETVNFISQQQKMINKKGVLQVKREQLSNKRIFTVKTFLKRFRHLFIRIIVPAYTDVWKEKEGE